MSESRFVKARAAVVVLAAAALLALGRAALRHGRAEALALEGWERLRGGRLAAAVGAFSRARELEPGNAPALRGLGEANFRLHRLQPASGVLLKRAGNCFESAVEASPADVFSLLRLWHIRSLAAGDEAARHVWFGRAASLAGSYPADAVLQGLLLQMASDLTGGGADPDGLPPDPAARGALAEGARFLLSRNEATFDSLRWLSRGLLAPPELIRALSSSESALRGLAEDLIGAGGWEERGGPLVAEAGRQGKPFFVLAAASVLDSRGRRAEAVDLLRGYLREHPGEASAHFALGESALHLPGYGWGFAQTHLGRAVELKPGDPRFRRVFGIRLMAAGDLERAGEQLRAAAALEPGSAETLKALGQLEERLRAREAAAGGEGKASGQ